MAIQLNVDTLAFSVAGKYYPRSGYEAFLGSHESVGIRSKQNRNVVVRPTHYEEWEDASGNAYSSLASLLTALGQI